MQNLRAEWRQLGPSTLKTALMWLRGQCVDTCLPPPPDARWPGVFGWFTEAALPPPWLPLLTAVFSTTLEPPNNDTTQVCVVVGFFKGTSSQLDFLLLFFLKFRGSFSVHSALTLLLLTGEVVALP